MTLPRDPLAEMERAADKMPPGPYSHDGDRVPAFAIIGIDTGDTYAIAFRDSNGIIIDKKRSMEIHAYFATLWPQRIKALIGVARAGMAVSESRGGSVYGDDIGVGTLDALDEALRGLDQEMGHG